MPCESCGRDFDEQIKQNDKEKKYCVECSHGDGSLKSQDEVREFLILYYVQKTGNEREAVEQVVDEILHKMPAWKMGGG